MLPSGKRDANASQGEAPNWSDFPGPMRPRSTSPPTSLSILSIDGLSLLEARVQPARRMRWVSRGGARMRMRAGGRRVCSRPAECAGSAAAGHAYACVQEGGACAADPPNALGQPRRGHAGRQACRREACVQRTRRMRWVSRGGGTHAHACRREARVQPMGQPCLMHTQRSSIPME